MDVGRIAALLAAITCAAACSGGKARGVEDARRAHAPGDAAAVVPLGPYRVDPTAKTGDVQIRVEWKDVPAALRASPGATPCGGPAVAPLAPTTTWGIPEAFVSIEVDHGKALPQARPRLALEGCALSPRVVVAGTTLAIASAVEEPETVTLAEIGQLPIGGAATAGTPHTLYLPIIGHEIETTLTAGSVYAVTFGASETATVVAASTPYVAVTEPTGQVIVRDVPVGTHPVRAWLPRRGSLEPRAGSGTVTVTEGALAEITLDLTSP